MIFTSYGTIITLGNRWLKINAALECTEWFFKRINVVTNETCCKESSLKMILFPIRYYTHTHTYNLEEHFINIENKNSNI